MALFAWLAGLLMNRVYAVPAVAALWTGLERTHATLGFTWMQLGNAAINMSVPLRLAPIVGVYGMSFVFAMLGTAAACVVLRQPRELHGVPADRDRLGQRGMRGGKPVRHRQQQTFR